MEDRFDVSHALRVARRRGLIVVLSVLAALAAAYGVTTLISPRYEATATLFVGGNTPSGEAGLDLQYASLAQSLVTSYAELAETRAVAEDAAEAAELDVSRIEGNVEAEARPGLQILKIRAEAASPVLAEQIANAVSEALAERVEEVNGAGSREVGVQVIDPAVAPSAAVSPKLLLNLIFGGLLGLLTGLGLAFARERMDTRIRTASEAERELGLPVLAVVPRWRKRIRAAEALARHANQEVADPFRRAAVVLATLAERDEKARVLVTSAGREEGKSTVASHLALALAEDNRATALIEGDLRRPSLRRHFPAPNAPSVSDVIYKTTKGKLPKATTVCPGLKVLAAGESKEDAALIVRTPQFEAMLDTALREHDHVVVDAPPALAVSDTSVLARHSDTVLLVVRAGSTRATDVREAQAGFKRLGIDVAGVVLVGARVPRSARYYYGPSMNRFSRTPQQKPVAEIKRAS